MLSHNQITLSRAFPTLVWHRQSWQILRPFMTLSTYEIEDLKSANVYCAGFTDETVKEREDLYDLLVDRKAFFFCIQVAKIILC